MAFRGGRGGFRDRGDLNRRGITKNLEGPAATFMPDHIKNLFRPREELTWMAPTEPPSMGDTGSALSGVSEFARWLKKDPPPIKREETPLERRRRRAAERDAAHAAVVEAAAKGWDPASDPKAKGSDPYRTLFVGRLALETNERKLEREFGEFGRVTGVRVVREPESGASRGYAFVEFESEDALKEAYRRADGRKVDGRRILVDVERGRTVPGFKPRRLGGGLGDTRGPRLPKRRKQDSWLKPPVPKTDGFITADSKRALAAAQQAAIDAASAAAAGSRAAAGGAGAAGAAVGAGAAVAGSVGVSGRTGYSVLFDGEMLKLARKAYDDAIAAAAKAREEAAAKAREEAEAAAKARADAAAAAAAGSNAMAADGTGEAAAAANAGADAGAEAEAGEGAVPGEDGAVEGSAAASGSATASAAGSMAEDGSAGAAAGASVDAAAPAPHGAPAHVEGDGSSAAAATGAAGSEEGQEPGAASGLLQVLAAEDADVAARGARARSRSRSRERQSPKQQDRRSADRDA